MKLGDRLRSTLEVLTGAGRGALSVIGLVCLSGMCATVSRV